ncbi:benzoate 1,2-dioxygenase electron transfer component BenC [Nocardia sp. NPDC101769]|uniref:benzoate 1,2-dioxygenase electron transfer component BenC n=1 Tax=Nocardia sp. NPDC101769 TaxID=3364333 RepID=UPI0037FACE4E
MSYQVALTFEDGVTRFIGCEADEVVADAAYRARVNIPLDCRDGACGTCKAFCESGSYDGGFYIDEALTEDEAAQGYCLPCQMSPESDLVLRVSGTSESAKTGAGNYDSRIVEVTPYSAGSAGLTVEIAADAGLSYLPGQYVNIEVPGTGVTRSYSFSNAPGGNRLTFLIRLLDSGVMSDYLRERAKPGDTLRFTGPRGSFFLRPVARPVLLIAGGTGLAPMLSMLESLRAREIGVPIRLIYGVSADADLVELGRLDEFRSALADFDYLTCVSDTASTSSNRGRVTDFLAAEQLHEGALDMYLCGPPPMVEAVRDRLRELGISPVGFHYEKFVTSGTQAHTEAAA